MKSIHIFRAGKHTSSNGTALEFSESDLQAMVSAYDPKLHEAPIVVGHPADNGPAFGWVGSMKIAGGDVFANPEQLNTDFAEQVQAGAYKKVSASLYTPEHPGNPAPGSYYLRHVGFLGAQPPAIKGLEAISFSDGDGEIVEFAAEWESAGIFRRLRDFFIEQFGVEKADQAIPGYLVEGIEDAYRAKQSEPEASPAYYSEGNTDTGETPMTEEELKAAAAKLKADQDALAAEQASFAEEQTTAAAAAETARVAGIHARVDSLVTAGKVLPADAAGVKSFAESLSAEQTLNFGEGDTASTKSPLDFYLDGLEAGKTGVDFNEHSAGDGTDDSQGLTAKELSEKALEYREEQRGKGIEMTITQAVNHVQSKA